MPAPWDYPVVGGSERRHADRLLCSDVHGLGHLQLHADQLLLALLQLAAAQLLGLGLLLFGQPCQLDR